MAALGWLLNLDFAGGAAVVVPDPFRAVLTHASVAGDSFQHAHTAGTQNQCDRLHANVAGATHVQGQPQGGV